MTYLNKGQFYPITLREVDNKGMQQPITKVRVRKKDLKKNTPETSNSLGGLFLDRNHTLNIIISESSPRVVYPLAECRDGGVWRGEVQR